MQFLKENWLWIVVPFAAFLALMGIVLFLMGGEPQEATFTYSNM